MVYVAFFSEKLAGTNFPSSRFSHSTPARAVFLVNAHFKWITEDEKAGRIRWQVLDASGSGRDWFYTVAVKAYFSDKNATLQPEVLMDKRFSIAIMVHVLHHRQQLRLIAF